MRPVHYRERSDRMTDSMVRYGYHDALLRMSSGRFARGTVLVPNVSIRLFARRINPFERRLSALCIIR